MGSLLYYACAVDNKVLVTLSTISISVRQAKATVNTKACVKILLDYMATYPNGRIVYQASDTILCGHADAGYLNKTNAQSWAGSHIYLLKNDPILKFDRAILTLAKFVMTSAAEEE